MKKFLKTSEVSQMTGYATEVIREFARTRKLPSYRREKNSDYRFLLSDVETFMLGKKSDSKKKK